MFVQKVFLNVLVSLGLFELWSSDRAKISCGCFCNHLHGCLIDSGVVSENALDTFPGFGYDIFIMVFTASTLSAAFFANSSPGSIRLPAERHSPHQPRILRWSRVHYAFRALCSLSKQVPTRLQHTHALALILLPPHLPGLW